jgi:repressor LexA
MRARRRDPEAVRRQILQAVEDGWRTDGRSPSYREMSATLGGRSLSVVKHHADVLVKQGVLRRAPGSRGLLPVRPSRMPMLGDIAAGAPLDVFDSRDVELLDLEMVIHALVDHGQSLKQEVYALRVRGDSMVDDGILDGDVAIIVAGPTVAPGAIAVALHKSANGGLGEVTLKHIDMATDAVRLRPANPAHTVRVITREEWDGEWTVQGALVEVRRRYS